MSSLIQDLQTKQNTFQEFYDLTVRVLKYLPNIVTDNISSRGYITVHLLNNGSIINIQANQKHANKIEDISASVIDDAFGL